MLDWLQPSGGLWGQFALGALLGIVWSPCSGPTLGAAVGLAPILLLAYGSRQAILARRGWMSEASRVGKPLMGAALVGIGLFIVTGLDKTVETALTNAMPDWLVSVTTRL